MAAPTIRSVELTIGDRTIRPLTADEVIRMVKTGILGGDERVELLDGVLTRMSPVSPEHGSVVARLNRWLDPAGNAGRFEVQIEGALVVPDRTSLPEPDLMVVSADRDPKRHPTTALLVIEVALSSLLIDTRRKTALYAEARVPEYWVVDVPGRKLEVFADPRSGEYAAHATHTPPATVTPEGLDLPELDLGALLAGT